MEEVLISVIVPVYNVEMYLSACLDSILSQSHKNLEVIVVNDGSTDFSVQIAESYAEKDDRVRVYIYENAGLSEARNRGLKVATGDFVTFVDADDMLFPEALNIMLEYIKREKADLVEGKIFRSHNIPEMVQPEKFRHITYKPVEAISDVLYQKRLLPSACGKLYRRALFDGLEFEKGILYEDLDIFYKILERCSKILWIDFYVYFYRDNEGSIINSWRPQRLDVLKVTENIEKYIEEKYPDILPSARDRRLSANFNMFALCSINRDPENARECWKNIKKYRNQSIFDPKVRMKNKAGILLSYFGKHIFRLVARRIYR